ncbi:MAG TPA: hypothetical protein VIG90_05680 [Pedomonas sp.]|uniref:hypothetical protein n=1 Tax=Pedomonas sp. TaxID=2976421 RepID=UPI002F40A5CA
MGEKREWLIWSMYHNAWHCRSSDGGAAGYTSNLLYAGLFDAAKANAYHDDPREPDARDRKVHISEAVSRLERERERLAEEMATVDEWLALAKEAAPAGRQ